jgi:hypothetical protein
MADLVSQFSGVLPTPPFAITKESRKIYKQSMSDKVLDCLASKL